MEANQIIILSAVLFFIIGFVIYFIGIIRIGRKNANKNKFRVYCPLNHGDIFKFETQLQAKIHSKMVEYLEKTEKPFSAISFEIHDNSTNYETTKRNY